VLCDDHLAVADEPVDLRGGGDRVVEDFGPGREGRVRQDDEARALVAGRDEGDREMGLAGAR